MVTRVFHEMLIYTDPDQMKQFVNEHPVLLNPENWEICRRFAKTMPKDEKDRARKALSLIQKLHKLYSTNPDEYPFGSGPIEKIWSRQLEAQISQRYALEIAGHTDITSHLSPFYVRIVSYHAMKHPNWESAVALQRILLNAVKGCQAVSQYLEMWNIVVRGWLDVVTRYLTKVPSGQLYSEAQRLGNELLTQQEGMHSSSDLLYRLGLMHLEPYRFLLLEFTRIAPFSFLREWFLGVYGDGGIDPSKIFSTASSRPDVDPMPDPKNAFRIAASYLKRAASASDEINKARSLSALAEALHGYRLMGGRISRTKIIQYACQSIPHLRNPNETANLIALLAKYDGQKAESCALKFLTESLDDMIEPLHLGELIEVFSILAAALPQLAVRPLDLLGGVRDAILKWPYINRFTLNMSHLRDKQVLSLLDFTMITEEINPNSDYYKRIAALELQARLMCIDCGFNSDKITGQLLEIGFDILERAQNETLPLDDVAYGLLTLASLGPEIKQVDSAIVLFEAAMSLSANLKNNGAHSLPVVMYVGATLYFSRACRKLVEGDASQAVSDYFQTLRYLLTLKLASPIRVVFLLLIELTNNNQLDRKGADDMVWGLSEYALDTEMEGGDLASLLIQTLCQGVFQNIINSRIIDAEQSTLLINVAKGLRYAEALTQAFGFRFFSADSYLESLRTEIDAMEQKLNDDIQLHAEQITHRIVRGPRDSFIKKLENIVDLDEKILVNAYTRPDVLSDSTAEERLENLRSEYDFQIDRKLLGLAEPTDLTQLPDMIQRELDDRTVLVNYYLVPERGNSFTIYRHFATREGLWMTYGSHTENHYHINDPAIDRDSMAASLNGIVSAVRSALINEDPGPRSETLRAANLLRLHRQVFLSDGDIELLEKLYKENGKDHLCIIPHGPLHFYPMHLLGPADHPLAEKWLITYLPNLRMLKPGRQDYFQIQHDMVANQREPEFKSASASYLYRPGISPITAFGVNYERCNPYSLSRLPNAVREAERIANLYNTKPIVEPAATKDEFIKALTRSRMVHIASHGCHRARQPSFQCIFLCPNAESDGVLYAHELLGVDARQLDLLTLGACETALGRFDLGDNLRGLPAYLFMAGVSTIIGTLWKVDTNAAEHFFYSLYERLASSHSNKLDAFRYAQESTRQSYRQYRQWGAFYFAGSWY